MLDILLNTNNSRISILRKLVKAIKVIHRIALIFRLPFLLFLLLITSDFHQAVEKSDEFHLIDLKRYLFVEEKNLFNQDYIDYVSENIDIVLSRSRFNGAVLISRRGQIIFERYSGLADLRNDSSETNNNTLFQLASVGKQFTAIAVMMLKERGLFDYDDPVRNYIDSFPYPNITIRHLLNHTSGLQNYMYLLDNYWDSDQLPTNDDLVELFNYHKLPLNFTPGRRFAYSNTGYAFLALLVEKVSNMPFPEFMRDELFIPLGMNNTYVYSINEIADAENRSYGFSGRNPRRFIPDDVHDGIMGDKGYFSTARDLYRWDQALSFFPPVSPESIKEATTRAVLTNGRSVSYGFGWRLKKLYGYDCVYHHGWWHGYRTAYKKVPEKDILIVILNNTNSNLGRIIREINKTMLSSPDCTYDLIADNY